MSFSVNTNQGAFVALQNLSATNKGMSVVQNRINTGLKVSSTKDDSAVFAIAQNLRSDVSGLKSVKSSLDRAKSTLDVAVSASEAISDVLVQMKEKALAASDAGLDVASRTALARDYEALADQVQTLVANASFNGTNLLQAVDSNAANAGSGSNVGGAVSALLSDNDAVAGGAFNPDTFTVANQAVFGFDDNGDADYADANETAVKLTIAVGADAFGSTPNATDAAAQVAAVEASISAMNTVLSTFGSASRQVDSQIKFVSKLNDTLETGIGNLVDADLARESAQLQSLQVKQQLGLQALSIANQAPQSVLSLFR